MDASEATFSPVEEHPLDRRGIPAAQQGFTLIELMIVVAIVGVLSAIAYPSYRDHVIRGNLVDATDALSGMQADMERYFQDRRTYAQTGAFSPPCMANPTVGNFALSCAGVPAANGYLLQAVGSGAVRGYNFTVNQQNVRTTTSPWGNCASAWILRKGQAC